MPHFIFRQGLYLGAQQWEQTHTRALRFGTRSEAEAGHADLKKQFPSLFTGAETIVARENEQPKGFAQTAGPAVHYDPFGLARK